LKTLPRSGEIFKPNEKSSSRFSFKAVFLRVVSARYSERFGIGRGEWRHIQRTQVAMHAHARRAVRRDVEVRAAHLDHPFSAIHSA